MKLKNFKMLSVVVPCYNEEGNIPLIVSKFDKILSETSEDIEVILVNNGSSDDSKMIMSETIAKTTQNIRTLNIEKNIGYGDGILSGNPNIIYAQSQEGYINKVFQLWYFSIRLFLGLLLGWDQAASQIFFFTCQGQLCGSIFKKHL